MSMESLKLVGEQGTIFQAINTPVYVAFSHQQQNIPVVGME